MQTGRSSPRQGSITPPNSKPFNLEENKTSQQEPQNDSKFITSDFPSESPWRLVKSDQNQARLSISADRKDAAEFSLEQASHALNLAQKYSKTTDRSSIESGELAFETFKYANKAVNLLQTAPRSERAERVLKEATRIRDNFKDSAFGFIYNKTKDTFSSFLTRNENNRYPDFVDVWRDLAALIYINNFYPDADEVKKLTSEAKKALSAYNDYNKRLLSSLGVDNAYYDKGKLLEDLYNILNKI